MPQLDMLGVELEALGKWSRATQVSTYLPTLKRPDAGASPDVVILPSFSLPGTTHRRHLTYDNSFTCLSYDSRFSFAFFIRSQSSCLPSAPLAFDLVGG